MTRPAAPGGASLVSALAAVALAAAGCKAEPASPPDAGARAEVAADAGARAITPLTRFAVDAAERALERARALARSAPASDADPGYLELRRAVACGAPFWRRRAQMGSEALVGPERSTDEAGGAMLLLDAALAAGDRELAARRAADVERALSLIRLEVERNALPPRSAASALSTAAFEAGALVLESSGGLPTGPAAVLADVRGTLNALELGAAALALEAPPDRRAAADAALAAVRAEAGVLRAAADRATTSLDLVDRASLAVRTGALGAAARKLAAAAGERPSLPYPARVPVASNGPGEPVSALTVPAARADRAGRDAAVETALAALGEDLFFDRRLSRGDARSCASCHIPARAFADGLPAPASLDPAEPLLRNTPTLLYAPLHAVQLWDGRRLTAERQALGVIHARAEMGLTGDELTAKLGADPALRAAFEATSGGLTADAVARALAAFQVRALVPADAPIDRFARGDEGALTPDMRAGLDVFSGPGRCARCHVPPFFGGSRPRDFAVPVFSVLGIPSDPSGKALDNDRGRAAVTGRALDERAFKTPTVRNIARTAPYFHHGRFPGLEAVVDFYNKGGGAGLKLPVENQDPDVRPLRLTDEQIRVLLVFMRKGLLDATPPERLASKPRRAEAPAPP